MTKPKTKGPTKAHLARQIKELKAQLAHVYHYASLTLPKAKDLMASGVMVELSGLGGKEITPAFVIRDGLSQETINALQKDIARSYELAVQQKPKGLA